MPHDISSAAVPGRETSSVPFSMPLPWLVITQGNGPLPGGRMQLALSVRPPLSKRDLARHDRMTGERRRAHPAGEREVGCGETRGARTARSRPSCRRARRRRPGSRRAPRDRRPAPRASAEAALPGHVGQSRPSSPRCFDEDAAGGQPEVAAHRAGAAADRERALGRPGCAKYCVRSMIIDSQPGK